MWKWEQITMDFITKLPRTTKGFDVTWVIVDRLTKSAYFLAVHESSSGEKLAHVYVHEIITWHGVPVSIISASVFSWCCEVGLTRSADLRSLNALSNTK